MIGIPKKRAVDNNYSLFLIKEVVNIAKKQYFMLRDGIKELCYAIVLQAIEDYKIALDMNDTIEINNIEKFFMSEWCEYLCNMHGSYIIKGVKKQYEEEKNNKRNEC